jgi:hypothetical protein
MPPPSRRRSSRALPPSLALAPSLYLFFVFSLSITPQEPQEKRTPSTKKGNSLPQKTEAHIKKIFPKGTFYFSASIFSLREIHTANGIDIKKVHTSATACAISTP